MGHLGFDRGWIGGAWARNGEKLACAGRGYLRHVPPLHAPLSAARFQQETTFSSQATRGTLTLLAFFNP